MTFSGDFLGVSDSAACTTAIGRMGSRLGSRGVVRWVREAPTCILSEGLKRPRARWSALLWM